MAGITTVSVFTILFPVPVIYKGFMLSTMGCPECAFSLFSPKFSDVWFYYTLTGFFGICSVALCTFPVCMDYYCGLLSSSIPYFDTNITNNALYIATRFDGENCQPDCRQACIIERFIYNKNDPALIKNSISHPHLLPFKKFACYNVESSEFHGGSF